MRAQHHRWRAERRIDLPPPCQAQQQRQQAEGIASVVR
jgi:hypothetical protein